MCLLLPKRRKEPENRGPGGRSSQEVHTGLVLRQTVRVFTEQVTPGRGWESFSTLAYEGGGKIELSLHGPQFVLLVYHLACDCGSGFLSLTPHDLVLSGGSWLGKACAAAQTPTGGSGRWGLEVVALTPI